MKSSTIIIILLVALCIAVYFLGKKNGTTEIKATIINNTQLVKQIAEISSLEVTGTTTAKISNVINEDGIWANMKKYFTENTLQVTIPYVAKYGVDVSKAEVNINQKDSVLTITLPPCKMLSLQLLLDRMETMNQTGLFAQTTIADMKKAEKRLYEASSEQLSNNAPLLEKAKQHISEIYNEYYKNFGCKVVCNFTQSQNLP